MKKFFDFPEEVPEIETVESTAETEKPKNVFKIWLPIILLAGMVVGFVTQIWTMGAVALVAGFLCIITGCTTIQKSYASMDWTTVWVLAGGLGFSTGLSQSGAGEIIANMVIGWFGNSLSFFALNCVFALLCVVFANLIPAATVMAMLAPIALFICQELGYDGRAMVMSLIMILNLSFISPVSIAPVTATLSGGYRFSDYVKLGSILTAIMLVVTLGSIYFFFC